MTRDYSYLYLTCADAEKERIARTLLEKRLIVCAKFVSVEAMYLWEGEIEGADEILIIMEAPSANFEAIERAVADIHSYDTFVLTAVSMSRISKDALKWIDRELT